MAKRFIEDTLEQIDKAYHPRTLPWVKANRPEKWREMVSLEEKINQVALRNSTEGLREALSEYQGLILSMVKEYKASKEKKGQGTLNFQGRKEMK